MTSEEARQQAQVEGLTLRVAGNTTGYFGVHLAKPGQRKPYQAASKRGGKKVHLGYFATAEEAALCIARSPEGQERQCTPENEDAVAENVKEEVPDWPESTIIEESTDGITNPVYVLDLDDEALDEALVKLKRVAAALSIELALAIELAVIRAGGCIRSSCRRERQDVAPAVNALRQRQQHKLRPRRHRDRPRQA